MILRREVETANELSNRVRQRRRQKALRELVALRDRLRSTLTGFTTEDYDLDMDDVGVIDRAIDALSGRI